MKKTLSTLFFYRWRYPLGYSALILTLLAVMAIALLHAPGGLTAAEINNLIPTEQLLQGNPHAVNLPLHALQAISFLLLGVSMVSIKLPSIILAALSAIAIFFLLRRWFKPGIATLSLSLMIATGQFMYIAQHFSGGVLYIFWTSLILLCASLVMQRAKNALMWKIALAISVALSLYTPYFWYINLGLCVVALIHPHTRYLLLAKKYRAGWLIAGSVFALCVAPLAFLCILQPTSLSQLFGWEALQMPTLESIKVLAWTYVWPAPTIVYGQVLPALDISALALIILGGLLSLQRWHTARSYMIGAWMVLSLPILLFVPHMSVLITVPLFILLAAGVESLLTQWYKLFPRNPYARGVGLLLLVALIGVMTISGVNRYVHSYHDIPTVAAEHSNDLSLLRGDVTKALPADTHAKLLVSPEEQSFYEIVTKRSPRMPLEVITQLDPNQQGAVVMTQRAHQTLNPPKESSLQRIIANSRHDNADRFYLYKIGQ